jgi:hypothetical protein
MTTITLLPLLESVRLERRRAVPAHLDLHYMSPQLLAASQPVRPDIDAVLSRDVKEQQPELLEPQKRPRQPQSRRHS